MKPLKSILLRSCVSGRQTMHYSMDFHIVKKSLAIWVLIIPLATVNGIMRKSILEPLMGKYALPLSGITLCSLIFALCWVLVPRLGTANQKTYLAVGVVWAILAAALECIMGIFLLKASWHEILNAYNPASGNLWVFVLLAIGISPWFSARNHAQNRTRIHLRVQ